MGEVGETRDMWAFLNGDERGKEWEKCNRNAHFSHFSHFCPLIPFLEKMFFPRLPISPTLNPTFNPLFPLSYSKSIPRPPNFPTLHHAYLVHEQSPLKVHISVTPLTFAFDRTR